jgi:hypothetical protein
MENHVTDYTKIKGWGVDADPENEPTYPMKNYTGEDRGRIHWERPPLQTENVEILHSIECPYMTATFGTSSPPSGLSGAIRRFAFKYSESVYLHWLPLVIADRVNVVEGIIDDLKKGIVPNIIKEKGWYAEWKYNKKGVVQKAAIAAGLIVAVSLFSSMRKTSKA